QTLPQPEGPNGRRVTWVVSWFPDGTRLLAAAYVNNSGPSIWTFAVVGGAARKLRDDAGAWNVSPDGKWIAFSTNRGECGDREAWLMGPDGENARKFFELDEHNGIWGGVWSPDSHRLLYGRLVCSSEAANGMEQVIESRDLNGGPAFTVLRSVPPSQEGGVQDFCWLPDGRVLYVLGEHGTIPDTCNYWEVQVDERTGKPRGRPRQLTNWAGFCMDNTGPSSADGKRVAFRKTSHRETPYVADLESNGTRLSNPRPLRTVRAMNFPPG